MKLRVGPMRLRSSQGRIVAAEYAKLPEALTIYQGNPCIEALGPLTSEAEIARQLRWSPQCKPEHRKLDAMERLHLLQHISQFFQPLSRDVHLSLLLSTLIRDGYTHSGRNPADLTYHRRAGEQIDTIVRYVELNSVPADRRQLPVRPLTLAKGFFLLGLSGVGKTYSFLRALDALFPLVIAHQEYQGRRINLMQVVRLYIDCPANGSIRDLCRGILAAFDDLLGTDYVRLYGGGRATTTEMIEGVSAVTVQHAVGILVVDEIQRLRCLRQDGDEKTLNYLVQLVNVLQVPLVLIGTDLARPTLSRLFAMARRGSGGPSWPRLAEKILEPDGTIRIDPDWRFFCERLWRLQYTRTVTPLTESLQRQFYGCCQGVPDVAVKLFIATQLRVIERRTIDPEERITAQLMDSVMDEDFPLTRAALRSLETGDKKGIKAYEDMREANALATEGCDLVAQSLVDMTQGNTLIDEHSDAEQVGEGRGTKKLRKKPKKHEATGLLAIAQKLSTAGQPGKHKAAPDAMYDALKEGGYCRMPTPVDQG